MDKLKIRLRLKRDAVSEFLSIFNITLTIFRYYVIILL